MDSSRYCMSFTTGSLFQRESILLASLFLEVGDWSSVCARVFSENLLQTRTSSSLKRIYREIASRLLTLQLDELRLLVESSPQEQAYLLWIAVCRRYTFIAEFAVEVLRERYITLKTDLSYEDFDSFFNRKAEWHTELDDISTKTRKKLRQVLFKILREADLVSSTGAINAAMLSTPVLQSIRQNGSDILFFPVFESDLLG